MLGLKKVFKRRRAEQVQFEPIDKKQYTINNVMLPRIVSCAAYDKEYREKWSFTIWEDATFIELANSLSAELAAMIQDGAFEVKISREDRELNVWVGVPSKFTKMALRKASTLSLDMGSESANM